MTVPAQQPWGSIGFYDYETHRDAQYQNYNTGEWYAASETSTPRTQVDKTRSATVSGSSVNGWRLPLPANATIFLEERGLYDHVRRASSLLHWSTRRPTSVVMVNDTIAAQESYFANLVNAADTGALVKLRDQKMELGVSLLEARRSINHLASTGLRLMEAVRAVRRGRFGTLAEILGVSTSRKGTLNAANHWLELQYAWRPLIWDVSAAYSIAQEGLIPPLTMRVERNVMGTGSIGYRLRKPLGTPYDTYNFRHELVEQSFEPKLGVKTILYTKVDSAFTQRLGNLGLINPVEIAWELVPFSFVVDWFVPVGTFLSACTAMIGQNFVSGTRTKWMSYDIQDEGMGGDTRYWKSAPPNQGSIRIRKFSYTRAALSAAPFPMLFGKYSLSTEKAVTASALFRQLSKR